VYCFQSQAQSDPADATLSHSDSTVEVQEPSQISDGYAEGVFQVFVKQGATADLAGEYWQRAVVDATGDSKQSWKGRVDISR